MIKFFESDNLAIMDIPGGWNIYRSIESLIVENNLYEEYKACVVQSLNHCKASDGLYYDFLRHLSQKYSTEGHFEKVKMEDAIFEKIQYRVFSELGLSDFLFI
ncbi:MAG: hypothetical protein RR162_01180 [Oscillospiraceae bacterium]